MSTITLTAPQYKLLGAVVETHIANLDWAEVAKVTGQDTGKKARDMWYPVKGKVTAVLNEDEKKPTIDLTDTQKTLVGAMIEVMSTGVIDWEAVDKKADRGTAKKCRDGWPGVRSKFSNEPKKPAAKGKGGKKRKAGEEATPEAGGEAGEEAGDEAPPAKKAKAAPKKKAKSEETVDEATEDTAPATKKKAAPKKAAAKKGAKKGKKADTPVDDGEQADEPANDNGDAEQQLNSEMGFDSTGVEIETSMVCDNGNYDGEEHQSLFNQGENGIYGII
ncbi:hypothetical protein LTR56_011914 [Elasticomyces elasticus]|nr:hypothetical protein LTR56_011914 [Elasticomyces elasticus]KAK3654816.1 hypothetical protein LTR22_010584 [Elasticomyces elasticus]KAK4920628.1 hypothetical protein LTR49_011877 [Elasticomyces elasticus]KAK5759345.1 hypothetical protein LTS12_010508 [Elasticomyces elasticus]